jgi:hypothetical protein
MYLYVGFEIMEKHSIFIISKILEIYLQLKTILEKAKIILNL